MARIQLLDWFASLDPSQTGMVERCTLESFADSLGVLTPQISVVFDSITDGKSGKCDYRSFLEVLFDCAVDNEDVKVADMFVLLEKTHAELEATIAELGKHASQFAQQAEGRAAILKQRLQETKAKLAKEDARVGRPFRARPKNDISAARKWPVPEKSHDPAEPHDLEASLLDKQLKDLKAQVTEGQRTWDAPRDEHWKFETWLTTIQFASVLADALKAPIESSSIGIDSQWLHALVNCGSKDIILHLLKSGGVLDKLADEIWARASALTKEIVAFGLTLSSMTQNEALADLRRSIITSTIDAVLSDCTKQLEFFCRDHSFEKKVRVETGLDEPRLQEEFREHFVRKAQEGMMQMVERYRHFEPDWFRSNEQFVKAVNVVHTLPTLARSWVACYMEDPTRRILDIHRWQFHEAQLDRCLLLQSQLASARARGMGFERDVQHCASKLCFEKGFVRGEGLDWLDQPAVEGGSVTPLIQKCFEGDTQAVRLLLEARASPNLIDRNTDTSPLHAASRAGEAEIIQALLISGADIEAATDSQSRPLHVAALCGRAHSARLLLEARANIEAADMDGCRPLHVASRFGQVAIVQVLLKARATIDARTAHGTTALHHSAAKGHFDTVRILIEARAGVETKDKGGRSAVDLASSKGYNQIAEMLRAAI